MSNYDNNMRGSIWKNDKKEKDTHPDFRGSAEVNGVEYWVSAWRRKEGANPNSPALSFSFQAKEEQRPTQQPQQAPATDKLAEDDIPF